MSILFSEVVAEMDEPHNSRENVARQVLRAFDLFKVGILVVDRESRIIFANKTAEGLLQIRGEKLHAAFEPESLQGRGGLEGIIKTAMSGQGYGPNHYVSLTTGSDKSVTALVIPSLGDEPSLDEPTVIVFVSDPAADEIDLDSVTRLYRLTGAEARLLSALLKGKRLSEYSNEAQITLYTAKGYLRQLFSKTRTTRQSELVRSILTNPLLRLISIPTIGSVRVTGSAAAPHHRDDVRPGRDRRKR